MQPGWGTCRPLWGPEVPAWPLPGLSHQGGTLCVSPRLFGRAVRARSGAPLLTCPLQGPSPQRALVTFLFPNLSNPSVRPLPSCTLGCYWAVAPPILWALSPNPGQMPISPWPGLPCSPFIWAKCPFWLGSLLTEETTRVAASWPHHLGTWRAAGSLGVGDPSQVLLASISSLMSSPPRLPATSCTPLEATVP